MYENTPLRRGRSAQRWVHPGALEILVGSAPVAAVLLGEHIAGLVRAVELAVFEIALLHGQYLGQREGEAQVWVVRVGEHYLLVILRRRRQHFVVSHIHIGGRHPVVEDAERSPLTSMKVRPGSIRKQGSGLM